MVNDRRNETKQNKTKKNEMKKKSKENYLVVRKNESIMLEMRI